MKRSYEQMRDLLDDAIFQPAQETWPAQQSGVLTLRFELAHVFSGQLHSSVKPELLVEATKILHGSDDRLDLWLSYPASDENQRVWNINITSDVDQSAVYAERTNGNLIFHAVWRRKPSDTHGLLSSERSSTPYSLTLTCEVQRKRLV